MCGALSFLIQPQGVAEILSLCNNSFTRDVVYAETVSLGKNEIFMRHEASS